MNTEAVEKVLWELNACNVDVTKDSSPTECGYVMCSCLHAPYTDKHQSNIDSTPSMRVSTTEDGSKSYYYCFTCHEQGYLTTLVKRMEYFRKRSYSELSTFINSNDKDDYVEDWESIRRRKQKKSLVSTATPVEPNSKFVNIYKSRYAIGYLRNRGINDYAIEKAGLLYDPYEKRVVFPVKAQDNLLYGYTSRSVLPKKWFPTRKIKENKRWDFKKEYPDELTYDPFYVKPNGRKVAVNYGKIRDYKGLKKTELILGAEHWVKDKPVLIIEGLFGYLHLLSIGADQEFNIGATMGASLSDFQASTLIKFARPVYLLFDNDPAGIFALHGDDKVDGAIDKLANSVSLFIPKWPEVLDTNTVETCEKELLDNGKVDGYVKKKGKWYKADPDKLTLDEIIYMKENAEMY